MSRYAAAKIVSAAALATATALLGASPATAVTATTTSTTCTPPVLSAGMTSSDVAYVQKKLGVSPASGYFGSMTYNAVVSFQKAHGISATGNVGPLTWTALGGYPGCTTSTTTTTTVLESLDKQVKDYLATRSNQASVAVFDNRTGVTYTYRGDVAYDTASIVKVQILATLLKQAQDAGRPLTDNEKSLADNMIRYSDNASATTLWNEVGADQGVAAVDSQLGLTATVPGTGGYWGLTQTTATDQVKLMNDLAYGTPVLTDASRSYELGLMRTVDPSEKWGVSAGTGSTDTVELKNGWLQRSTDGLWRVHSIGHVSGSGRDYTIAVLTTAGTSESYGIDTISGVSKIVYSTLANPLR